MTSPYDPAPNATLARLIRVNRLDGQQLRTLDKKHQFLRAYEKTFGNVRKACALAGIKSTKTFYNWCANDLEFKKAVNLTFEIQRDFVHDLILMKILKGHGPTLRWYLSHVDPRYRVKRTTMPPQKPTDPWELWAKRQMNLEPEEEGSV
jgi:hypothetical protein